MKKSSIFTTVTLAMMTAASFGPAALAQTAPATGATEAAPVPADDADMGPNPGFNFDAIDADTDGKITQAELDAYRAGEAAAIDTDGDGLLSAAELAAMQVRRMTERATEMATKLVEKLDTDGDGKLSAVEMAARPMPGLLFDKLDTDGDGAISKAEAGAAREKMHDRAEGKGRHGKGGGERGDRGDRGDRGARDGWFGLFGD